MKITYTYTLEDLYEVTLRERRRYFRRPWDIAKSVVVWTLIYVPLAAWFLNALRVSESYPGVIFVAGSCGVLMLAYDSMTARSRIYAYHEQTLGGRGPFSCEVELTPAALEIRQFGSETRYPWNCVTDVCATDSGVEIALGTRSPAIIRSNGFSSVADREAFMHCAREFMASSVTASRLPELN